MNEWKIGYLTFQSTIFYLEIWQKRERERERELALVGAMGSKNIHWMWDKGETSLLQMKTRPVIASSVTNGNKTGYSFVLGLNLLRVQWFF